MSINPVSRNLLPYRSPSAAANSSAAATSSSTVGTAALAIDAPDTTARQDTPTPATRSNSERDGQPESAFDIALRQTRISTGTSTEEASTFASDRYRPAIGLYQRVSKYSDDRTSVSGLTKSWNDIVRENQFDAAGVASYVKTVAQNDALALPSSVLHLTV